MESPDHHEAIFGLTRSGKTWHVCARADNWPGPVLYVNLQDQVLEVGAWTRAGMHDSLPLMVKSRRARINYVPNEDLRIARREVAALVNFLMRQGHVWPVPILVILDEADEFSPEGQLWTPGIRLAARGGKHNVWVWLATQFPAQLSKKAVRNCFRCVYFPSPGLAAYLNEKKLPGDQIEARLLEAPKYSFVTFTHPNLLDGPFTTLPDGTEKKLVTLAK
jgi:hypothetical protein